MKGNGDDDSGRLFEVLNRYLADLDAGLAPDREQLLDEHRDLRERLAVCLDSLEFIRQTESAPRLQLPEGAEGTIGDYRVVREVGRGGMGVVYEAEQISLQRRVALKMLPFAGVLEPRVLQRFRNEALAAAALNHPHIVPVYAVGQDRGIHHYAMQFIDGISVADVIRALRQGNGENLSGSSSEAFASITGGRGARSGDYCRAVARLGAQAAEALDHAHACGVVHRDVKPGNLLVDSRGELWVTDFGLASVRTRPGLTVTGDLVGTLRYMSPEQTRAGQLPVDHRTDIYSLGTALYEFATLEGAFQDDDAAGVLQNIANRRPPPPRTLNPAVPDELETILLKAMEKDPNDRYGTARELADDLRRFLAHEPIRARRPTLLQRTGKWLTRRKRVVAAGVGVLLLAVVGLVVASALIWRQKERAQSNLRRGLAFVENTLGWVSTEPRLSGAHRKILEDALDFYTGGSIAASESELALDDEGRGRILHMLGRREEAAAALREGLGRLTGDEHAPDRIRLGRRLGEVHADLGRYGEAARAFEDALAEAEALPDAESGAHVRAEILLAIGRLRKRASSHGEADEAYEAARELLKALVEKHPGEPEYRYDLAKCCHRLYALRKETGAGEASGLLMDAMGLARGLVSEYRDDPRYANLDGAVYRTFMFSGEEISIDPAVSRPERDYGSTPADIGPDWMPFLAACAPIHARGEEPYFVVQTLQGTSNVLGKFEAEAWIYVFRTLEGAKGTTRCTLSDGDGNELVVQFFAQQDKETDDFVGSFVILEGTGRFQGAVGGGRHRIIHRGQAGIELRMEGRIRRE